MSDVVLVAIIGIAGTLLASIVAPIAERLMQSRADKRAELGDALQQLGQLSARMVKLPIGSKKHERLRLRYLDEVRRIELIGPNDSGRVTQMLDIASVLTNKGNSKVDQAHAGMMAGAAVSLAMDWYRGERSADQAADGYFQQWDFMRKAIVGGFFDNAIPDAELTFDELTERQELRTKYEGGFGQLMMERLAASQPPSTGWRRVAAALRRRD